MASTTTTEEPDLVLMAPAPVKVLAPEKAAGLVPLKDEQRSQLDEKVDGFIADLVAPVSYTHLTLPTKRIV